ncbi:MAG: hypothetical protein IJZ08_08740 [Clostridia bacterium]|nr:hypothetical protein [Clostridia bacterium]
MSVIAIRQNLSIRTIVIRTHAMQQGAKTEEAVMVGTVPNTLVLRADVLLKKPLDLNIVPPTNVCTVLAITLEADTVSTVTNTSVPKADATIKNPCSPITA